VLLSGEMSSVGPRLPEVSTPPSAQPTTQRRSDISPEEEYIELSPAVVPGDLDTLHDPSSGPSGEGDDVDPPSPVPAPPPHARIPLVPGRHHPTNATGPWMEDTLAKIKKVVDSVLFSIGSSKPAGPHTTVEVSSTTNSNAEEKKGGNMRPSTDDFIGAPRQPGSPEGEVPSEQGEDRHPSESDTYIATNNLTSVEGTRDPAAVPGSAEGLILRDQFMGDEEASRASNPADDKKGGNVAPVQVPTPDGVQAGARAQRGSGAGGARGIKVEVEPGDLGEEVGARISKGKVRRGGKGKLRRRGKGKINGFNNLTQRIVGRNRNSDRSGTHQEELSERINVNNDKNNTPKTDKNNNLITNLTDNINEEQQIKSIPNNIIFQNNSNKVNSDETIPLLTNNLGDSKTKLTDGLSQRTKENNASDSRDLKNKQTISSVTDLLFTVPNERVIKPAENSEVKSQIKSTEELVRTSLEDLLFRVPQVRPGQGSEAESHDLDPFTNKSVTDNLHIIEHSTKPLHESERTASVISDSDKHIDNISISSLPKDTIKENVNQLPSRGDSAEGFQGELIIRSPCLPVASVGRLKINNLSYTVTGLGVGDRAEDCWRAVTKVVKDTVHLPPLNHSTLVATTAFYFIARSANLIEPDMSFGYVKAGAFREAAIQMCVRNPAELPDPLACLDYQYVAALLLHGLNLDPESEI
ncbi:unnamed protein product, partial [Meganyctiphanes norvegica]